MKCKSNGPGCLVSAEPAVAPDRGGITVFQGSASHQPPRQVNGVVRRGRPESGEAVKMAGASRKAALTHRIRVAAGRALAACPEERWPILEGRIEEVHRLCDEGELEHAVVMLMAFLCQNPYGVGELLDDLHDFAKRLSLGPA